VKKKIAMVQPTMDLGGGTEAVTAWTIEALKKDYDVTLITYSPVLARELNDFYGTHLEDHEVTIVRPRLPALLGRTKRFTYLKDHLMMRYCKSVKDGFNLFIGAGVGYDFGAPTIQYVGLGPGSALVKMLNRQPGSLPWYYSLKTGFIRFCERVSNFSLEHSRKNITLVNSHWTGKVVQDTFNLTEYQVIYPPVEDPPTNNHWQNRKNGFLCIARIVPEKRIDEVIRILEQVRKSGFDVSLQIVGRPDDSNYADGIQRLADENSSWLTFSGVLPKDQLFPLMNENRYGINGALDEPFGIAVAELVKAGCIVFAPNGGGQKEILGTPELVFDNRDDGAQKIIQVLEDEALQQAMLTKLARRSEAFSTAAFCEGTQRVVTQYFKGA
jgi:glycosyltransferase involved in cell wall biosynthesis